MSSFKPLSITNTLELRVVRLQRRGNIKLCRRDRVLFADVDEFKSSRDTPFLGVVMEEAGDRGRKMQNALILFTVALKELNFSV